MSYDLVDGNVLMNFLEKNVSNWLIWRLNALREEHYSWTHDHQVELHWRSLYCCCKNLIVKNSIDKEMTYVVLLVLVWHELVCIFCDFAITISFRAWVKIHHIDWPFPQWFDLCFIACYTIRSCVLQLLLR